MRARLLLAFLTVGVLWLNAHDIITTKLTFTRDVSPILANRCSGCHGERDSIPLTTYDQVRPWAVSVKEQVLQRKMPPWGAVKGFGYFKNDQALSQEEILILASWVVGGAPQGDPLYLTQKSLMMRVRKPDVSAHSLTITANQPLPTALIVLGIRPLLRDRIESAKIVARKPNGEIVPLVWLYQHESNCEGDYQFVQPLTLPAGTRVDSPVPIAFDVPAKAQPPGV